MATMFCVSCETDAFVIDDPITGDCVCTSCGVVISQDCMLKKSFNDLSHSSVRSHSKVSQNISKMCEKYSISTDITGLVEEWLQKNYDLNEKTSADKIRMGVCVINLYQYHSNTYVSMTEVRRWSSRLSVDEDTVVGFLDKLKVCHINQSQSESSSQSEMSSCRAEWTSSLQKKCFQVLTDVFTMITIERKTAWRVKKECVRVIQEKSTVSIIGMEYLSACIIRRLFQNDFEAIDTSLIISLGLKKYRFLSSYNMIYK